MPPKKGKGGGGGEENVSLKPATREGEVVFGVAHSLPSASFTASTERCHPQLPQPAAAAVMTAAIYANPLCNRGLG